MLKKLQHWFAPLYFEGDEEKTLKAKLLNVILLTFLIAAALYAIFVPIHPTMRLRRFILVAPFILSLLAIQGALRRGYVQFAGQAVVFTAWALITLAMGFGAGYNNPAFMGYLVVVVCAGLVLGRLATIAWAAICIVTSGLMVAAADLGILTPRLGPVTGATYWIAQSSFILVVGVLLSLTLTSMDDALARATHELKERQRAEEREQRRSELLGKIFLLGKAVTEVTQFRTTLLRIWHGVQHDLDFDRVGLFLYNPRDNSMQGTFGTDRTGKMIEAWYVKFDLDPQTFFYDVVRSPHGLYFTKDYEKANHVPPQHEMAGVKYYAAVAVRAGDKPVAIIAVDQLITGRPITEEQLEALRLFAGYAGLAIENARLNQELELRVEERTKQLELANKDLEAFSYSVSHDLRAPLRAINGFASVLQEDYAVEMQEMGQSFVTRILENTRRMTQLINDLLAFSRLGRHALQKKQLEPAPIVQEVWEELLGQHEHREIIFIQGALPVCEADPTLLRQVFTNLLGNALKYSSTRETARIEIGWRGGAYFVQDNGVGFDMDYAGKLFGVFQRLHRTDEFEGTGVGLATVHRIIEQHGGRIWFESEVDKGATFFFTLQPQAAL